MKNLVFLTTYFAIFDHINMAYFMLENHIKIQALIIKTGLCERRSTFHFKNGIFQNCPLNIMHYLTPNTKIHPQMYLSVHQEFVSQQIFIAMSLNWGMESVKITIMDNFVTMILAIVVIKLQILTIVAIVNANRIHLIGQVFMDGIMYGCHLFLFKKNKIIHFFLFV